jgi:hypothetical protein
VQFLVTVGALAQQRSGLLRGVAQRFKLRDVKGRSRQALLYQLTAEGRR